ncbi:hypothetical protein C0995_001064 [Termitomyces sp. Mi166|nr:hypothetical protein C0995_001064 [Termitomyces sp. Mi166\
MSTCINSNPDISGIGVRVAIYIQNFLSFVPAIAALRDGKVAFTELESLEAQSTTILITALAILISTIIQAHRDNGITNYHALIVLNLSWMNNTNLFIYFLLYAFRRAHLTPQQRMDEDRSLDDVEWAALLPRHRWISKALRNVLLGQGAQGRYSEIKDQETANHLREDRDQDFEIQSHHIGGPMKQTLNQLLWVEIKRVFMDPVIIIGSLHLTFMAAIGIWLWSHPAAFGSSNTCTLSMSIFVLGIDVQLGSEALRMWSILVYSILLIPMLNLIIPIAFFAILLAFKQNRLYPQDDHGYFIQHCQTVMGLGVLGLIEAILLINTEVTLAKNSHLVETGETDWTFGQTLAVLVLLVPLRDLLQSVLDKGAQKQRKRLLLSAVNGAKGMVEVLLDLGVKKKDLNTLLDFKERTSFELAAECQQGDIIKYLLGIKPDDTDWSSPPLYAILKKGRKDLFQIMINHGASINALDQKKCTALHWAVKERNENAIKVLQEHKANREAVDMQQHTALHLAAQRGHQDTVKLLLEYRSYVDAKNKDGQTALYLAVEKGHQNVVKILLGNNADINIKDNHNELTILQFAAQSGNSDTVKVLLDHHADVHVKNKDEQTALHLAAWRGNSHTVKILLEHHANVHVKDKNEETPLHFAARVGNSDTVKLLLENHADVDVKYNDGKTALHVAAQWGNPDTVKILLEYHADVHVKDKNEKTALHSAAQRGKSDTVKVLLEHNADVNTKDNDGKTALHVAAQWGNPDTVKVLLGHNADVHAKGEVPAKSNFQKINTVSADHNEQTVLHVAAQGGRSDNVKILLEHNADVNVKDKDEQTALHVAAQRGKSDTVKALLEHNADVDVKGKVFTITNTDERTALHVAAWRENTHTVKTLLEHYADVHVKDQNGQTALHLAAWSGRSDIVKWLLVHNADVHTKDNNEQIALHLAAQKGQQTTVELLLKNSANVHAKNKEGSTALDLATLEGHQNVVEVLRHQMPMHKSQMRISI